MICPPSLAASRTRATAFLELAFRVWAALHLDECNSGRSLFGRGDFPNALSDRALKPSRLALRHLESDRLQSAACAVRYRLRVTADLSEFFWPRFERDGGHRPLAYAKSYFTESAGTIFNALECDRDSPVCISSRRRCRELRESRRFCRARRPPLIRLAQRRCIDGRAELAVPRQMKNWLPAEFGSCERAIESTPRMCGLDC